jgi:hypothetical protein
MSVSSGICLEATILWKILKKGELQQSTERALKLIRARFAPSEINRIKEG